LLFCQVELGIEMLGGMIDRRQVHFIDLIL